MSLLKKLRGAVGLAVTWGALWAAIFAAIVTVVGFIDPDSIDPGEVPVRVAMIGAVYGLVSGAVVALLFAVAERRKTIRDLSLGRAALWGAIGTAVFPLFTQVSDSMVLILCPIGAALAAGSVAIAKRAELAAPPDAARLPGT